MKKGRRDFMKMAIEEAKKSKEHIGCGVVIVKDGVVLSKTYNRQRELCNACAHAEILALQDAGQKLGNKYLENCEVYCTCEPCTMCLSAMIFAKVPLLYYGTSMLETFPDRLPITLTSKELMAHAEHKIKILKNFLHDECTMLLKG